MLNEKKKKKKKKKRNKLNNKQNKTKKKKESKLQLRRFIVGSELAITSEFNSHWVARISDRLPKTAKFSEWLEIHHVG